MSSVEIWNHFPGCVCLKNIFTGHRAVILDWCQNKLNEQPSDDTFSIKDVSFSPILREMIISASSNYHKTPNAHRFSKLLMDFSVYMYIMAGKATYDILCANLPLPKSGTVGMIFRLTTHYGWLAYPDFLCL